MKLDRLGWAAGIALVSHGAHIGVRVTDPSVLDRLDDFLPPGWRHARSPVVDNLYSLVVGGDGPRRGLRRYHLVYAGAALVTRTHDLAEALQNLESLVHFQVALSARSKLFVHAGVVGWRGRALVIPGRSRSGKSALVAELVRAGATYYSDEYAIFDSLGRVHPYPKALSLRGEPGGRAARQPIEAWGGQRGTKPLRVGLVVNTVYQRGARWRPRMLTPGQGLLTLLDNTVLARVRPEFALETLQQVVPGTITLAGKRGEVDGLAPALLQRLEDSVDERRNGRLQAGRRENAHAAPGTAKQLASPRTDGRAGGLRPGARRSAQLEPDRSLRPAPV